MYAWKIGCWRRKRDAQTANGTAALQGSNRAYLYVWSPAKMPTPGIEHGGVAQSAKYGSAGNKGLHVDCKPGDADFGLEVVHKKMSSSCYLSATL
jgi:hypothetical protein